MSLIRFRSASSRIARLAEQFLLLRREDLVFRLLLVIVLQGILDGRLDELDDRVADPRQKPDAAADRQPDDCPEQTGPQLFEMLPEGHRALLEQIALGGRLGHGAMLSEVTSFKAGRAEAATGKAAAAEVTSPPTNSRPVPNYL